MVNFSVISEVRNHRTFAVNAAFGIVSLVGSSDSGFGLRTQNTGSGTSNVPFCYKIFYYKIISMSFCNIPTSHSSTPYHTLGEMLKLKQ